MKLLVPTGASILFAISLAGASGPEFKGPRPPEALASQGVVYRTITGREAQVTFTSDAPLEDIVGKSNAVAGYAVVGPGDLPAGLLGAEWALSVESLATGIPLRDEHMKAKAWLDAESYPVIRFVLSRIEDAQPIRQGEDFSTWSVTLVGEMTMHGVTRTLRVPGARLSFLKESDRTRAIAGGDVMLLKCDYEVRLSDYGMRHGDVPDKVSDTIRLSQLLRLTTAPDSASSGPPADR